MNVWLRDGLLALGASSILAVVAYFLFYGHGNLWNAYLLSPLFFIMLVIGRPAKNG